MNKNIWFTSDLHFCHNKEFLFQPRGFNTVEDMNEAIVQNWNSIVTPFDDIYVLGDLMLNDNEKGIELLNSLKGNIHVILGNHDTDTRINLYNNCSNISKIEYVTILKYGKYRFYLSHYPTITSNVDEKHFSQHLFNLYGHTHQQTNFYNDIPWIYHVGVDSHNCTPVHIDQIIEECKIKYKSYTEIV